MTTSNTNPDWMRDLKLNFAAEIVEPCSQRTRKAVENNEDIEVRIGEEMFANNCMHFIQRLKEHAEVKKELLGSICTKLQSILAGMRMPGEPVSLNH